MTKARFGGMAALMAVAVAACTSAMSVRARTAAPPLSSVVPHDVDTTGIPVTLPALEALFDDFSWRSFVALSWPALANGTPDPRRQIGQNGDAAAVFEHFAMAEDVFPAGRAVPAPWGSPPRVPPVCGTATRVFSMMTKAPATPNGVVSEFAQALTTGPLIDQNRVYVRYAVQLNRDAFDFIVTNRLYDASAQRQMGAIAFPSGALDGDRVGAITTKAAWKILGAGDDPGRFHRTTAWVYTPAGAGVSESCVQQQLGLVGFHIAHKTQSRPQWVWSTFEHIDNAPLDTARRRATFFNPACSGSFCTPNALAPLPWDPSHPGAPTQVTRMTPLRPEPAAANGRWQAALRAVDVTSPWQYYMLVDAQWPTRPGDTPGLGSPDPTFVANTVIETFIQNRGVGIGAGSSCMGCHLGATIVGSPPTAADFSYLLLRADHTSGSRRR